MMSVYRLFAMAAAPAALAWLRWKAAGPQSARSRWRERTGRPPAVDPPALWLHAASVGEVNGAQALVAALIERFPDHHLVISAFTATGLARAEQLFGPQATTTFIPLDTPRRVNRWLEKIRPAAGIIVETEIWPELFAQCKAREIPLILVNARLAPGAMKHYRKWQGLYAPALEAVSLAAAQSQADAQRLREIGLPADRIEMTGNLKFDLPLPGRDDPHVARFREQWRNHRTWVAGSTREGEENIVLDAHRRIMQRAPDALLVLAPRHPERCGDIRRLLDEYGLANQPVDEALRADTPVVLIDRLGLLQACYAAAPVAFVGGSLVDIGGHNLLEPAALGKVVIAGAHLHQQAEAAQALNEANALLRVDNAQQLAEAVLDAWHDEESAQRRGRAALSVVESGRGSTGRTLEVIERALSPTIEAGR